MTPEEFYQSMTDGRCVRPRATFTVPTADPPFEPRTIEITHPAQVEIMVAEIRALFSVATKILGCPRVHEVKVLIECPCGNKAEITI